MSDSIHDLELSKIEKKDAPQSLSFNKHNVNQNRRISFEHFRNIRTTKIIKYGFLGVILIFLLFELLRDSGPNSSQATLSKLERILQLLSSLTGAPAQVLALNGTSLH